MSNSSGSNSNGNGNNNNNNVISNGINPSSNNAANTQQHELQIRDAGHYYEFEFKSKAFLKLREFMDRLKQDNKEAQHQRKDDNFTLYHPKIDNFTIQYSQENNVVTAWKQKQRDLNPYKFAYHLWSKMSAQLRLYNSTDFKNENVSEIKVCPYSLDFKYTFQELKKSFYFRVSYIAYCNHIEDEANYNPIGFSETPHPEILTNQNYLINFNLNNGFWEKSTDLLDGISREFAISYIAYKLSRGKISESNSSYQIFLDLFIKFLNVVPYSSSVTVFASREITVGLAGKGKQQTQSEVLAQIQLSFSNENSNLSKNQIYLNQSNISKEMHPLKYPGANSSQAMQQIMSRRLSWSGFQMFNSFFSNVQNVSIIESRKCGIFTYGSEREVENFLIASYSFVYTNMLLQLLFIHLPPSALKDTINLDQQIAGANNNNTTTSTSSPNVNQFKITLKLDPELLRMNLENFTIIVDTQSLYEPITISLQHYFFDQDKQTELSIFYLKINSKNDARIFENELMFYLAEISPGKQTKYIVNLLVFAQIFGLLRQNVKDNFQDIYKELNSEMQNFFFDYSSLSFEKDPTTNQLMINRLEFKQIHSFSNRERFSTNQTGIAVIKSDKFTINRLEFDLSVELDKTKIKDIVEQIVQFSHNNFSESYQNSKQS